MPSPIAGEARTQLGADLAAQYEQGTPIRGLVESSGRSYGFIHQLLTEAGVTLRARAAPMNNLSRLSLPPQVFLGAVAVVGGST